MLLLGEGPPFSLLIIPVQLFDLLTDLGLINVEQMVPIASGPGRFGLLAIGAILVLRFDLDNLEDDILG